MVLAGTMVNARLDTCIWGAPDAKMGCAGSLHDLLQTTGFNHQVAHWGGVQAEHSIALLQDFFRAKRQANKKQRASQQHPK